MCRTGRGSYHNSGTVLYVTEACPMNTMELKTLDIKPFSRLAISFIATLQTQDVTTITYNS